MNDQKVKTMFDQADELYRTAQEELARPEEDVVPYMVYRCTYKAIDKYLAAFLLKNGVEVHNSMSLKVMLEKCREIDPKFNDLNLDPLLQSEDSENVWTDIKTVKEYMELTSQTLKLMA